MYRVVFPYICRGWIRFFVDQRNKILILSSNIMLKMLLSASTCSWIFLFKCTCSFPRSHTVKQHNNINISCWKRVNQNQNLCTIYELKISGFLFYWMCFKHRKIISSFNSYLQMPPEAAVIHTHASVSHYSQSEHRKQQLISQSERAGDSQ